MFTRRNVLATGLAASLMPHEGWAQQDWPVSPIQMIVPFAPGGATDIGARVLADDLSRELKQPVVVENRAGAGGNVGAEYASQQAPDGYTLMTGTQAMLTFNPHLQPNQNFDPR